MCVVVEPVTDNSVSDKAEDGKGESKTVSVFDFRTANVKETAIESAKVEENKDETRGPRVVNSVTKKVEEDKIVRVSKSMNDAKSVSNLMNNKSVIDEVDEDLSGTREKELQGSSTTKAINDTSVMEPAVLDISAWELRRSSSRNKIPTSRSSDFLWYHKKGMLM